MTVRDTIHGLRSLGVEDWRLAQALGLDRRQFEAWLTTPGRALPPSAVAGVRRYLRRWARVAREAADAVRSARDEY